MAWNKSGIIRWVVVVLSWYVSHVSTCTNISIAWNKSGQASVVTPLFALLAMANRITRRAAGR